MLSAFTATAQDFEPTKPIDFVIMAGAGGGADQIARFLQSVAEKEDLTNRPLVPNNKGGGSGAEALIALNGTNDPDHTILVTLNSFFTTPLRQENLGIDVTTFTPVAMMGVDPFVLWVHKDSGITSFEQWLETVRAAGGEYVMGGTGTGQEDSLVIEFMENAYDLDIKYIPYEGGGAVAKDLAGQQIMATVNNPAEAKGFLRGGRRRAAGGLLRRAAAGIPGRSDRQGKGPGLQLLQPAGRCRRAGSVARGGRLLPGPVRDDLQHPGMAGLHGDPRASRRSG